MFFGIFLIMLVFLWRDDNLQVQLYSRGYKNRAIGKKLFWTLPIF